MIRLYRAVLFTLITLLTADLAGQTVVPMHNGKVRLCKAKITDSDLGQIKGDYGHNENYTLTISVPGAKSITLKFTSFCTEKDNDILRIFDGKDTFATLMGTWSGSKGPGTITSTDSFITLHFITDKSVACTGWEAELSTVIITPTPPTLSMNQSAKCNDDFIIIKTNKPVPCDSMKVSNASLSGPIAISPASITAQNCSGGTATIFRVNLNGKLNLNGAYSFTIKTYYKDFCDSIYELTSKVNFSVADCPLTVVLTADADTLCKGTCTFLRVAVSGGNPSKYVYSWTPAGISGAGPHKICPTVNTRYILMVTDGISIPSADTVDIAVLDPPVAMPDTMVCYYSGNFFLRGTPAGGKWYGKGVVNSSTGEYKPLGNYGNNKVWYQVGSCADTMYVNSTLPWNLENVFCPGTGARAVWWYGPAGGTWSGPKITPSGIFNPDVPGTYQDTYTWKGCISVKTILVQNIVVPKFDTTCESITSDTLQFSPKGIYPNYFVGLTNSYYGWYNPSAMGGPQTKMIIWNGGGCRDTTMLTVLASEAGPTDTFCPDAGIQILTNFRPLTGFTWSGHGITDPAKAEYDPSFLKALGKTTYRDTLVIRSGRCRDQKYVYLFPTVISKKDTLFYCFETPAVNLNSLNIGISPAGGIWSGPGITGGKTFTPAAAGYGSHQLIYSNNGCNDTIHAFIRPKPVVQADTTVCITSGIFKCYARNSGGTFTGKGIVSATLGTFNPAIAGRGTWPITYRSKEGCIAVFNIQVDTVPVLRFLNTVTDFCFRDTNILLTVNQSGGTFSGPGVSGNRFNPKNAGSGSHTLTYSLSSGTCTGSATFDVFVSDTLKVVPNPATDTICPGEIVWLRSTGKGGDPGSYSFIWSNGQTGSGTFVSPKTTTTYRVTLTDGCSERATADVTIHKHPQPWFDVVTSQPRCYGLNGYAVAKMKDNDPYSFSWDISPAFSGDSLVAPAGNSYRLTAKNLRTGCQSDTLIQIPGYAAIKAGFILNIGGGERCVTNIFPELKVFNSSQGGVTGTWYWGDGSSEVFDPNTNPSHVYNGDKDKYRIKLVIFNQGGCKDSIETEICFRDTVVVFIPNSFTPNSDNRNENFFAIANGARTYKLIIYNRWGQIIFESTNPAQGWDGTYNNRPCPEGIYTYQLIYKGRKTFTQQKRGSIILMRPE